MTHQPKSYKKFVATAATATLVASALVPTASAATPNFTDVSGQYKEAVSYIVENNIAQGTTETTFGTAQNISRGDAAVMIANALKLNTENAPDAGFQDVNNRVSPAVNAIVEAGIASGRTATSFDPAAYITRQEMAKMLANAYQLEADTNAGFTDVNNNWIGYVSALKEAGITLGKTETTFAPIDNLTRGEFALFMHRAETMEVVLELKSATATSSKTLSVTLSDNTVHEVTLEEALVSNVPTKVTFTIQGNEYTATVTYVNVAAEVVSINAINASELKVTFNSAVDEKTATDSVNYDLKINNVDVADATLLDINLSTDGKTATILLDQSVTAFQNGDKYVIQTNDAILSKDGKKLEKFVSNEATFSETAAPSLVSVAKSGDNLRLTFDRPVDAQTTNDVTLIKVDGIEIGSKDLKPVYAKANGSDILGEAGRYVYQIAITDADAKTEAKKVGTHEVVIFDVADTASAYEKVASVLTGSYTVTNEVTTPEVIGIEAVNANRFFVYTNTGVTLGPDAVVTVNKGSHEFKVDGSKYDNAINKATNTTVSDAWASTYQGKPGLWVVVTDNEGATAVQDENPLYRSGETTVDLTVTVEKFTANGLIGKKAVETVKLNKYNTEPVVETTVLKENAAGVADELVVSFTNPLVQLNGSTLTSLPNTDYIVRDKDGIIIEGFAAVVNGKDVTFRKGTEDLKDAPYTVEFKEGKFKNADELTVVSSYLANTVKNNKIVVSVGKEAASNFKYTEFNFNSANTTVVNTVDENSITFKYPAKMGDSARNVANYTLDGKALPAGTTADFVGDRETVRVVFPKGTFKTSTQYKFGVTTNVKTEADSIIVGSLQTKAPAEFVFGVRDNVKPEIASAIYYVATETVDNQTTTSKIELTFNEAVQLDTRAGANVNNDFAVIINGSKFDVASVAKATSGDNKDRKLVLTLNDQINVAQAATISIVAEQDQTGANAIAKEVSVLDLAGNKAKEGSSATATTYKYDAGYAAGNPPVDTALENAKASVATAETSKTRADVDTAQALVTALADSADKTALQVRLDAIEVEGEEVLEGTKLSELSTDAYRITDDTALLDQFTVRITLDQLPTDLQGGSGYTLTIGTTVIDFTPGITNPNFNTVGVPVTVAPTLADVENAIIKKK